MQECGSVKTRILAYLMRYLIKNYTYSCKNFELLLLGLSLPKSTDIPLAIVKCYIKSVSILWTV